MTVYDLFLSYRRKDAAQVLPLVEALQASGLVVWLDQQVIGDFAAITDEIRAGLARSKALLAWYSIDYPKSRPCQMELTAALVAARRGGDPRLRVLVINPESTATHVQPVELRDQQQLPAPRDADGYADAARRIAAHVATLPDELGATIPLSPAAQYGLKLTGTRQFAGRLADLWRIHSALHGIESAIISGEAASGLAIVRGMGGIGKSMLAQEYALRFAAAFPGGVFWLRALGYDGSATGADANEVQRAEQLRMVAMALSLEVKDKSPDQIDALVGERLAASGRPFLWVVDDLAPGLASDALRRWLAPAPLGKTLITTRSREYDAVGHPVPLEVMTPEEAYELLCSRRRPKRVEEETACRQIAADLGFHPLALAVTAAALEADQGLRSFAEFRVALGDVAADELELAAALADMLPTGHEKSVASTLLRSIRGLGEAGRDFLEIAAALTVAPIPRQFIADTLAMMGAPPPPSVQQARIGIHAALGASLAAEADDEGGISVHALVSRTVLRNLRDAERAAFITRTVTAALAWRFAKPGTPGLDSLVPHARHRTRVQTDVAAAQLANALGSHEFHSINWFAAVSDLERAATILESVPQVKPADAAAVLMNLALAYEKTGRMNWAISVAEQAEEICENHLPDDHPTRLSTLASAGEIWLAAKQPQKALSLYERVAELRKRIFGQDHPLTLKTELNMAEALHALNCFSEASVLQARVVDIRRRDLGPTHADTLRAMNNLASSLVELEGHLAGAVNLYRQVLNARIEVLGEDDIETISSHHNLGETLLRVGDADAVSELCLAAEGCDRLGISYTPLGALMSWNLYRALLTAKASPEAEQVRRDRLEYLLNKPADNLHRYEIEIVQGLRSGDGSHG